MIKVKSIFLIICLISLSFLSFILDILKSVINCIDRIVDMLLIKLE